MKPAVDTTVLVAALDASDPDHVAARNLLTTRKCMACSHALSETFSTLTGGRLGFRIAPGDAARLLHKTLSKRLHWITLSPADLLQAYAQASDRGIRGGAIYDYLHLVAARKAGAPVFHTLNTADFESFHRPGDPRIAGV